MIWMQHSLLRIIFLAIWLPIPVFAAWHVANAEFCKELKVAEDGRAIVTATTTVFLDDRYPAFILTDLEGGARPFSIIDRSGSRASIHFEAQPGETLLLYPLTKATPPKSSAPLCSGLLHQTRSYDGSEISSSAQFNQHWQAAPAQGGGFVDNVYTSFNPYGPNSNTLHRYEGTLINDKPGETTFCVASTDASFLFINDREVASWPGKHSVNDGLNGSKRGTIKLDKGACRFTFLHANSGSSSFAIAAMISSGEKQHFVIEPDSFTHAVYAFVTPLRRRDGNQQADFTWENKYMVNIHQHCMYQLLFEAAAVKSDPDATYNWEFSDGTRARGRKVEHLVFKKGDFSAKLTLTSQRRKSICRQTADITPRYGQNENDDKRTLALLKKGVEQEKSHGIQGQGYALISHGWFFLLREKEAAAFAPRVLAAAKRIPPADLNELMIELAMNIQQVDEQYELAERCFRTIIAKVKDPGARAFAALHCGGMLNLCLNRPQDARDLLSSINRADLDSGNQRLLDIYLADTALILNDFATAQKMYRAISKPLAQIEDGKLNRSVIFDYNSRHFRLENLLSQKLYRESLEAMDMIEWEMPEERASPRMNLMKVQALIGNRQPEKAVVCLQRALLAEADETYTPRLRLELARLYVDMSRFAQAKHQINLIRKESPWTREELDARTLLKGLEDKLREM